MAQALTTRNRVSRNGEKAISAREKILEVAEQLIVQLGTNGFSYQHIADMVGIRKASIHHHFPTKTDLILELGTAKANFFFVRMNQIMISRNGVIEKLNQYFGLFEENFIHGCGGSIGFFGMLGAELGSQDDRVAERVRSFFAENVSRLSVMIAEGMNEGALRRVGDPDTVATVIFSALEGAMIIVRASGDVGKYSAVIEQLTRMIVADG